MHPFILFAIHGLFISHYTGTVSHNVENNGDSESGRLEF